MEELISPRQASKMFGITTETLRKWELLGKVKCIKTLGGHRRFKLCEIESLLKNDNEEDKNGNK